MRKDTHFLRISQFFEAMKVIVKTNNLHKEIFEAKLLIQNTLGEKILNNQNMNNNLYYIHWENNISC